MGNKRLISKEEFKQGYAQRSDITLEQLNEFGLEAYSCDCGEKGCQGWQMLHKPPYYNLEGGNKVDAN